MISNPNYYWQPYHQLALIEYITVTGASIIQTQHRIFNEILYTPLTHMASQALYSTGVPLSDSYNDYINDILIHLYAKVLPNITVDRATTFLHYAYTSCRNYIISKILMCNNTHKRIDYTDVDIEVEGNLYTDDMVNRYDTTVQIVERLDYMIKQQKIMNKTNTIFLLLLRQYLIDNNFNPVGFKTYLMKTMNIKSTTFIGICSRLRITTKIFKEDECI